MIKKQEKGAALLTAILITSVVAVLASNILSNQQEWITQTGLADRQDRFNLTADRIVDWANTAATMRSQMVDPSQLPPWPSFEKTMQDITVKAQLSDGNTRYNLNWLVDPSMDSSFARVIEALKPDIDPKQALLLAQSVTATIQLSQGIKPTTQQKAKGADDRNGVPVVGPLHDLNQLNMIKGFSASLLVSLKPYLSVLPVKAGINITTGNLVVMKALLKPSQDQETLWMAYLSCRQSFASQQPNATAWQACLQQNDGQNFLMNFGASDAPSTADSSNYPNTNNPQNFNNTQFQSQQIMIYRSNYAWLNATMKQADLSSRIHAIYWLPNQKIAPASPWLVRNSWITNSLKVTLVSYWRS